MDCLAESLSPLCRGAGVHKSLVTSPSSNGNTLMRLHLLLEIDSLGQEGPVHQSYLCTGQSTSHPSSGNSHPPSDNGHMSLLSCTKGLWNLLYLCICHTQGLDDLENL